MPKQDWYRAHTILLAQSGPSRQGGTACSRDVRVPLYQTPREKNPSSASTTITIRMIQRMPNALPPLSR